MNSTFNVLVIISRTRSLIIAENEQKKREQAGGEGAERVTLRIKQAACDISTSVVNLSLHKSQN